MASVNLSKFSTLREINDKVLAEMAVFVSEELRKLKEAGAKRPNQMIIDYDSDLTKPEVVSYSEKLSLRFGFPVLVLPKCDKAVEGLKVGSYCRIPFKVISEMDQSKMSIELARFYKNNDRESGLLLWKLVFSGGNTPMKWSSEDDDCFKVIKKAYICKAEKQTFLALTDEELIIGEEYVGKGLTFETKRVQEIRLALDIRQSVALLDDITDPTLSEPSAETLAKCKGKPFEWFIESTMFPYHHCVRSFGELMTLNLFHVATGFPFNVMLIGEPNLGKTAILRKISVIAGDDMATGGGTIKGLLPSFYSTYINAGLLGTARYKAVVNEFFTYVDSLAPSEKATTLSKLKDVLEGAKVTFRSGVGLMQIRQTADLVAGSNPPKKNLKEGWATNILELYDCFEPALMDRMLFYWIPSEQKRLVDEWKSWAKIRENEAGGVECLSALNQGSFLTIEELRIFMGFCKRASYVVEDEVYFDSVVKDVVSRMPVGKFSRNFEFLANMATAYAFIRNISEGTLSAKVVVRNKDLDQARSFLLALIAGYERISEVYSPRAIKISGLTPAESGVFSVLALAFESANKFCKPVSWGDLGSFAERRDDLRVILGVLASKRLCAFNEEKVIFLPELSLQAWGLLVGVAHGEEFVLSNEQSGELTDDGMIIAHLVKLGLLGKASDGSLSCTWTSLREIDYQQRVLESERLEEALRGGLTQKEDVVEDVDVMDWDGPERGVKDLRAFIAFLFSGADSRTWKTTAQVVEKGFSEELLKVLYKEGSIRQVKPGLWTPAH